MINIPPFPPPSPLPLSPFTPLPLFFFFYIVESLPSPLSIATSQGEPLPFSVATSQGKLLPPIASGITGSGRQTIISRKRSDRPAAHARVRLAKPRSRCAAPASSSPFCSSLLSAPAVSARTSTDPPPTPAHRRRRRKLLPTRTIIFHPCPCCPWSLCGPVWLMSSTSASAPPPWVNYFMVPMPVLLHPG